MRLPEPFYLAGEHLAIDLPGSRALFTTRRGGSAVVKDNRESLERRLGVRFAYGRQVHGARVRLTAVPGEGVPSEADGQATATYGVGAMVLTADCLPIAIAGEGAVGAGAVAGKGAVAMLHAGWRGLAAGVVGTGARAVRQLGARGELVAAIGPGAGVCCYEVGEEVHAVFAAHGPWSRQGNNLDLGAIARSELERAGVTLVHDAGLCTICSLEPSSARHPASPYARGSNHPVGRFFSHRRERGSPGRQAGIAWLT